MRAHLLIATIPFLLAFMPLNGDLNTEYYYNLKFMKDSGPPRAVEMVRIDNLARKMPVASKGILFTYRNRSAGHVHIAGNFSDWTPLPMERSEKGVWYYFLDSPDTSRLITYKFSVDGIWMQDPENPDCEDDGCGSYLSLARPVNSDTGRRLTYRFISRTIVEFRIYRPDAKFVALVGDFNHWNPENDLLKKGSDGIWRARKQLREGTYLYRYVIDGEWLPDTYNSISATDRTGMLCSVIVVGRTGVTAP